MKFVQRSTIIFLFLITAVKLDGQNYSFYKPEINDWFPSRIFKIIQDKKGYYWLGSEFGVTRFDNLNSINFGTQDHLARGGVYSILEDTIGRIWMGHLRGGITVFESGFFREMKFDSVVLHSDIKSITQENKFFWIRTSDNEIIKTRFPLKGDSVLKARVFLKGDGLGNVIYSDYLSSDNEYYALCDEGLRKYNAAKDVFERFSISGLNETDTATLMYSDSKTNYWLALSNGDVLFMDKYNAKTIRYHNIFGRNRVPISVLFEGSDGYFWVGSRGKGIARILAEEVTILNQSNGLDALFINTITEDSETKILITGEYNGLFVFSRNEIYSFSERNGISHDNVNSVVEDKNDRIWIGTDRVMNILSGKSTPAGNSDISVLEVAEDIHTTSIKKDTMGNLWFTSDNKEIWKYNILNGKIRKEEKLTDYLRSNGGYVCGPEIDARDILWFGVQKGVVSWNPKAGSGTMYHLDFAPLSVSSGFENRIWIVTVESKLYIINSLNGEMKTTELGVEIFPTVIHEEIKGNLLIGTANDGVYVYRDGEFLEHYNKGHGLESDYVTAINVNRNDDVFIGTPVGLYIIDHKDKTIKFISKNTGLADNYVNHNAIYFDSKGFTWIGTRGGVSRIPADLSLLLKPAPLPHIGSIEVNSKINNADSISKLRYSENNIAFEVGSGSFSNPATISYSAKLEGFNKEFVNYGRTTKISYPFLAPGDYTFILLAKNDSGNISQEVIFPFTIRKPWWNTNVARVTYMILLISAFYFFLKFRERKLQKDNIRLEKIVEARTAEIVEQRDLIASQKKDITDSINYALKIQTSLMPPQEYIESVLKDYFIFYKPRDVLSGDFYWIGSNESQIIVVGADCTGHGVPGSLLSMLGLTYIDEIVKSEDYIKPGKILDKLRARLLNAFKFADSNSSMKDGMDIAVGSYDRKKKELTYAGAKNPLYLVQNGKLTEFKADRDSITFSEEIKKYRDNVISLEKGDSIYIFSDGFADQFGGPFNKKYGYSRLRDFLERIHDVPMKEQKSMLESEFHTWIGDNQQVDDVMVIGVRI